MDWFLYDNGLRLERVNNTSKGASMSAVIRNCNCELAETGFHNIYIIYNAGIFSD